MIEAVNNVWAGYEKRFGVETMKLLTATGERLWNEVVADEELDRKLEGSVTITEVFMAWMERAVQVVSEEVLSDRVNPEALKAAATIAIVNAMLTQLEKMLVLDRRYGTK